MKYLNFDGLSHFLSKLRGVFAVVGHTHTKSEITDYVVDSAMSSTSTNPVQNKVVNTALSGKVSTSRKINGKALTADITLSASDVGADASGTAATKANEALASAKTYADEKVADLVDSAPDTLNTLNELATAIQEHQDVTDALDAAITKKVDKVEGKGLSTNDYTDEDKAKLVALEAEVEKKAEGVDWNENDSTSPAYVKNRTHWVEGEESQLLQATINGEYVDDLSFTSYLEEGQIYTVTWDGVRYSCLARNDGYDRIYIGNQSIGISVDEWFFPETIQSNEPFFICTYDDSSDGWGIVLCEGGTHTVEIYGMVSTFHKIDKRYLPEMVGKPGIGKGSAVFNGASPVSATGYHSHAEGTQEVGWVNDTIQEAPFGAHGDHSHAEGENVYASGHADHAEGAYTIATGGTSHAEGRSTEANGECAHSEGYSAQANGYISHAEGGWTIANGEFQHVQGLFNIADDTSLHIVGNGRQSGFESNAHTLAWDGTAWYAGDVYVGSTSGKNKDEGSKKLATEDYVTTLVGETPVSEQISTALVDCGMLTLDPNDTTISGEATPINADTLTGLTYDQVKTDIVSAATEAAPVQSVNGATGDVVVSTLITPNCDVYARNEVGYPGINISGCTASGESLSFKGAIRFALNDVRNGYPVIEQVNPEDSSIARVYTTANPPSYADVGAAAASHTHNVITDSSTGAVAHITVNSGVPTMFWSLNGVTNFGFARENDSMIKYHKYSNGTYTHTATSWDTDNLSFSLSGTTLYITKS